MHYAFFIFFFQNMEGMDKLLTPPFKAKSSLAAWEDFPPPRGFGLHMIWLASMLDLLWALCRELGSAYFQYKGQFIQVPLLAKQQIALLWELG